MKVKGCKYVMIILLLAENLVSKFFLFKNGSGKFLVKQENSSSPGCKEDTCLSSSIINKIEILDEKERKRGKDYDSNNEVCECGIANEHDGEEKKNRILFSTEVKHHTYPWVVQIFLDRTNCK